MPRPARNDGAAPAAVCWALWVPRLGRVGMPLWCPMAAQQGPPCGKCIPVPREAPDAQA